MNYEQTIQYLYNLLPVYHRIGAKAFKPGLDNMYKILEHLGNPHQNLKFIHVGGTNGKGSSSHLIASILQESGYKVGLYTSPHLKRFTERIRINGKEIDKQRVVSFVENNKSLIEDLKPSFFELTVGMAFEEFEFQQVDYAVIEVGLGGRLDSTNIINPLLSLITNISYDHTDLLGDTLVKIASEKAGIIKKNKPVVISERNLETDFVFESKAESLFSELNFAEDHFTLKNFNVLNGYSVVEFLDNSLGGITTYKLPLLGEHQIKNLFGVLMAFKILSKIIPNISATSIQDGIQHVLINTNLKGRWQKLGENPLTICDTGHNEAGILEVVKGINSLQYSNLHMILGISKDKNIEKILGLLPPKARLYFCSSSSTRLTDPQELVTIATELGFRAESCGEINQSIASVKEMASPDDFIFIGGSNFIVGEINDL